MFVYNPHIKIIQEWQELLFEEFDKPYFKDIKKHYLKAREEHKTIFPRGDLTFHALNLTPPQKLKIIILGQDPYHGSQIIDNKEIPQAMGLSFSVPYGFPPPPSLKNIYKELASTTSFTPPDHGNLTQWAQRGVLLLNAILSVEKNKPASHQHFGWEQFTDAIISCISRNFEGMIFLLWGNFARKKAVLIDPARHSILCAPHPSPLAKGFVGSGIFTQVDLALKQYGKEPMDWSLADPRQNLAHRRI